VCRVLEKTVFLIRSCSFFTQTALTWDPIISIPTSFSCSLSLPYNTQEKRILSSHVTRLYKPNPPSLALAFCLLFLTKHYPTPVFRPTTKASFIWWNEMLWWFTSFFVWLLPFLSNIMRTMYCLSMCDKVSHYYIAKLHRQSFFFVVFNAR